MKLYLAGGAVRDLLLGRPITDRDYLVTNTSRQAFLKAHQDAEEVGRTFPIFLLNGMEFAFPRADSLEEELKARDLTVNALLLDENGELICHPQALDDLLNKTLRAASPDSLRDDPLRVFRAARFWAKLPDFSPHDQLIVDMRQVAADGHLDKLPADRVGQELIKVLNTHSPGNFLRLLADADCLAPWFEEFDHGRTIPAGPLPYHDTNVVEHTCRTMDALAGDDIAVWMALCHDIGKTMTDQAELPRHFGHDKTGMGIAYNLAKRLRLSNAHASAGAKAAQWHMVAAKYDELRPGTKVDMLMDLHFARIMFPFFKLVLIDQDKDFIDEARSDLRTILRISLPKAYMDLGPESGSRLRELRAQALTKKHKK